MSSAEADVEIEGQPWLDEIEARQRAVVEALRDLLMHAGGQPDDAPAILEDLRRLRKKHARLWAQAQREHHYRAFRRRGEERLRRAARGREPNADALLLEAHMVRLETLERRKHGQGRAVEEASKITFDELTKREQQAARARVFAAPTTPEQRKQQLVRGRPPSRDAALIVDILVLLQARVREPLGYSTVAIGKEINRRTGPTVHFLRVLTAHLNMKMSDDMLVGCIRRFRSRP